MPSKILKKIENIDLIANKMNNYILTNKNNTKNVRDNLELIKKILIKNKLKIIKSIEKDTGKNLDDGYKEFKASLEILNYAKKKLKKIVLVEEILKGKQKIGKINFVPIGVVGIITPWNYPLLTLFERLPFCIGSGSAAIVKLSEYTPNFSILIKQILNNKNLKRCLYFTKSNHPITGKKLCNSRNVSLISFTGSSNTAKKILIQGAPTLKKTSLELGGKNPAIITRFANIDFSVDKVIDGIFENGGQACVGISRVLIHHSKYDIFITSLIKKILKLKTEKKLKLQLPANKIQKKLVLNYIEHIKRKFKNKIITTLDLGAKKFTPIFLNFNSPNKFFSENEFFFPIVTFEKFHKLKKSIKMANETNYGLACYVFTRNKDEASVILKNLQFGRIWINNSLKWTPELPVGGFKFSGSGRDMGFDGFKNYMTTKSTYFGK